MEEKKKILIAVLAAVVIFVLGTAAFLGIEKLTGVKGSRKIPQTAGQGAAEQTNTARQEAPEGPADAEGADPAAGTAAVSDNSGTGGEPADTAAQEAQNSLLGYEAAQEEALLKAAVYDYDAAIELMTPYAQEHDEAAKIIENCRAEKAACVAVDVTNVPHVFFHSLINDDRAFKADLIGADRVRQNNAAMTTVKEFDVMIQAMYDAGYVLIGLDDMCVKTTEADGTVRISPNTQLMLPEGKKPFVLSEDDLSYYHSYGIGTQGYATRMVVDENGLPKCEYTDENGETHIGDYDVVPRLDTFIREHPDFAYHGARGTVAMTGYNGVFGYRTNDYYKDINDPHLDPDQIQWLQDHPDFDWERDCAEAKKVADAMKAEGWTFASHTYGHLNAGSADLERLQRDNERWKTVNQPVLGETDKIIFAFGADIGYVGGYTADNAKYQYFKDQGYSIFCNVDGNIGWTEFGDTFMRTGRVALDGFTIYQAMTEGAAVHSVYAKDYERLGISGIASFFNPLRPTPIDSE